ncbi:beta-N-acetylhexosaminidase [uncultured Sphingorhabdus sp.]|uniref:beta-N-acetylhexosaminidase n=1 Tax=uncultured Sphingorhabdus sp. TaxID=1686106 RepID=UPI002618305C|nr:beta-N-acetylhexosaminidase [uncultured Sphingorhabdus sp.]
MKPVIFGLSGEELTPDERALFAEVNPVGYTFFRRNIRDREQLRALTDSLRSINGREDVLIFIDQEGGRVMRMQPPTWPDFPPGSAFDALYDISAMTAIEAARVNAEALGLVLNQVGITVNYLPVLDVRVPDPPPAIGDRAMGSDPMRVAALGRAVLDGLQKGGVAGVIKHMPGHGRALVDSHFELPHVHATREELEQDIAPFRALNTATMGMTAHLVYDAWDAERCATMSPTVIHDIIRSEIGFDGLLMSDDLEMKALKGDVPTHAVDCIAAGCDVALNCWGRFDEMVAIVERLPDISNEARRRFDAATAALPSVTFDQQRLDFLLAKRDELLALAEHLADEKATKAATGASWA